MTRRARTNGETIELIELVDVDPAAFGAGHDVIGVRFDGPAEAPRSDAPIASATASAWRVGAAMFALLLAAGATAAALRPWYRDPVLIVRSATVQPSLTDQLVIGRYPGVARSAEIVSPSSALADGIRGGAVFAATPGVDGTTARSATYYVVADTAGTNNPPADDSTEPITVQGTLGTITQNGSSILVQWHPADGVVSVLRTRGLDRAATLRLASQLVVRGDTVRVGHRSALQGMHAVGTIADAQQLGAVFEAAQAYAGEPTFGPLGGSSRIVAVRYPAAAVAVGTSVGPGTDEFLALSFPAVAHTTADGYDAVVVDTSTSNGRTRTTRTTVVWTEHGRIIAVSASSRALAEQYAEAVRPATADEWLQVQHLSAPSPGRPSGGSARVV
jgi:hypothetical protein